MTKGINLMSAGGTRYTTQSTGGGDKKSGSVPRGTGFMLGSSTRTAVLGANGRGSGKPIPDNYKFPFLNQLSGIGRGRSMTTGNADGVNKKLCLKKVLHDFPNSAITSDDSKVTHYGRWEVNCIRRHSNGRCRQAAVRPEGGGLVQIVDLQP